MISLGGNATPGHGTHGMCICRRALIGFWVHREDYWNGVCSAAYQVADRSSNSGRRSLGCWRAFDCFKPGWIGHVREALYSAATP